MKPFALELYEQYLGGMTAEQLAQSNCISIERIQMRLRAAAAFTGRAGRASDFRPEASVRVRIAGRDS